MNEKHKNVTDKPIVSIANTARPHCQDQHFYFEKFHSFLTHCQLIVMIEPQSICVGFFFIVRARQMQISLQKMQCNCEFVSVKYHHITLHTHSVFVSFNE